MNDRPSRDDPLDLTALDPMRDRAQFDLRIASITREAITARSHLSERGPLKANGVVTSIIAWATPTLLAASVIFVLAISAVARMEMATVAVPHVSAAEAMGIPQSLRELLQSSRTPSLVELNVALASNVAR